MAKARPAYSRVRHAGGNASHPTPANSAAASFMNAEMWIALATSPMRVWHCLRCAKRKHCSLSHSVLGDLMKQPINVTPG
eukprot:5787463-Lingulodinium_polyedra.AAC.1